MKGSDIEPMHFSVIIPVAPERDAPVLGSIAEMNFAKDKYELFVERGLNPSLNRNRGIEKSKSEILAFVDDDAYVHPDWLSEAKAFFDKYSDVDIVGGPQLTPKSDKAFARHSGYVLMSFFGTFRISSRYKRGKINLHADEFNLTSANMFVRKRIFDKEAPFDPRLFPNEETEFLQRVKKAGYKIAYSSDIVVYHKRRDSFFAYLKQIFGYGKGRARQDVITGTFSKLRVLVPLSLLVYLILAPLLFLVSPLLLIPLLVYFAVAAMNAVYISAKNKDIFVVASFPILCLLTHITYPFGYVYERLKILISKDVRKIHD